MDKEILDQYESSRQFLKHMLEKTGEKKYQTDINKLEKDFENHTKSINYNEA